MSRALACAVLFALGVASAASAALPQPGSLVPGRSLGAVQAQVTKLAGATVPVTCTGYDALVSDKGSTRTVYYIVAGKLWGFGLLKATESPCR